MRIYGSIDRIDRLPSGGIEVIDYKTGKISSQKGVDENLQLTIYALACRDALGLGTPERVTLYFTESATRLSTTRTDEQLDAARDEILARVRRSAPASSRRRPARPASGATIGRCARSGRDGGPGVQPILGGMPDDLTPGLHEALVTEALRARIERARAQGWLVEWKAIDDSTLAAILARHIHDRARQRMDGIPSSVVDRRRAQVDLANRVLETLASYSTSASEATCRRRRQLLLDVAPPPKSDQPRPLRPRPGISLRDSVLLTNGHRDLQIGGQVALEIQSADRIDLLCAFVRFAGVRMIRKELQEFLLRGGQMRVIASVYTGRQRSEHSMSWWGLERR